MTDYKIIEREEQPMTVEKENDVKRIVYRITTGKNDLNDIELLRIAREITDKEEENGHFHALTVFFWKEGDQVG
ncbi:MAG: hypothetical protein KKD44_29385, partial [Proteobacteria bacterium]|nr:hypothetical protein [Pseudomonadota bacterium]